MGQAESRQEKFWEACGFGHTDKVKQFLLEGIGVNWVSKTHDSSPIHAASQGKPLITKLLLEAGADVNVKDERGCSALHHACMNGYSDCGKLLIDAGAAVNVQDKNGWTPLHCASYWCHPDTVELLLEHKADVNIKNKDDRLAIHEAARSKSAQETELGDICHHLITAGSDIESKAGAEGQSDFTVLMFASYHGHVSVIQTLLDARCEINAQGANKWTALHWSVDRDHTSVVELLLEHNADLLIKGNRGEIPKDRVRSDVCKSIIKKYEAESNKPINHLTAELNSKGSNEQASNSDSTNESKSKLEETTNDQGNNSTPSSEKPGSNEISNEQAVSTDSINVITDNIDPSCEESQNSLSTTQPSNLQVNKCKPTNQMEDNMKPNYELVKSSESIDSQATRTVPTCGQAVEMEQANEQTDNQQGAQSEHCSGHSESSDRYQAKSVPASLETNYHEAMPQTEECVSKAIDVNLRFVATKSSPVGCETKHDQTGLSESVEPNLKHNNEHVSATDEVPTESLKSEDNSNCATVGQQIENVSADSNQEKLTVDCEGTKADPANQ